MKKVTVEKSNLIVSPKGPRLNLTPVFDRFFITSPDAGQEEMGKVGGIHLPENSMVNFASYAVVEVLVAGPKCLAVKAGDRVLVVRPQCNKIVHDGQEYWFTTEQAIMGIIRP